MLSLLPGLSVCYESSEKFKGRMHDIVSLGFALAAGLTGVSRPHCSIFDCNTNVIKQTNERITKFVLNLYEHL